MVQQNYFLICIQRNFRSLSKIVLFMYTLESLYRSLNFARKPGR